MAVLAFEAALWRVPGESGWHFTQSGSYLLPVKRSVREAAGLHSGDTIGVRLETVAAG